MTQGSKRQCSFKEGGAMNEKIIEVEANSLTEARQQLLSHVTDDLVIIQEDIVSRGNLQTVEAIADTLEKAFAEAKSKVPAGATIVKRETIVAPERKVNQVEGKNEQDALASIQYFLDPKRRTIESFSLKCAGRKGFLGVGKTPNTYELTTLEKAKVKISFREKAKIKARMGSPVRCQRCGEKVLRESHFRDECGRAGLLLIDGNLYGGSGDRDKVEIYRKLENRKGFRCSLCSNIYCSACLFEFAPSHVNGGKACFSCRGRFERFE